MSRCRSSLMPLFFVVLSVMLGACSTKSSQPQTGKTTAASPVVSPPHSGGGDEASSPALTEVTGKHEQEACAPSKVDERFGRSDCEEGLVCAPDVYDVSKGTCRVDCAKIEGDSITKDATKCPAGRSCQIAVSLTLEEMGAFCLPKQVARDAQCQALGDPESCSNNRSCLPSSISRDESGAVAAQSFICRDTCPFGTPEADKKCATAESCIESPYDSTRQSDEAGKPVVCQDTHCAPGNTECECDVANGFKCKAVVPGLLSICERSGGICVAGVSWASSADFAEGFSGQKCNEISDHRFCKADQLAGLENGAQPTCVPFPNGNGQGFCFAFCSAPALDSDGDGKIGEGEKGEKLACPTGYECSLSLGRNIGLVKSIKDPNGNREKACDPSKCERGKPCLAECGVGDAECLTFEGEGQKVSFCGAPFGNCQPAAL